MHRTCGRFNIERWMRAGSAIFLFLTCCAASAQWAPSGSVESRANENIAKEAGFPNWDEAMYASCTNNRADVSAGTTNSFSTILYPYGNWFAGAPSSYPENQSLAGYSISFYTAYTTACGEAFWGSLEAGYTVEEARGEAFEAYQGSNKPQLETDFMHVWGDFYTRLKGVYTGDQSSPSPSTWYRNL